MPRSRAMLVRVALHVVMSARLVLAPRALLSPLAQHRGLTPRALRVLVPQLVQRHAVMRQLPSPHPPRQHAWHPAGGNCHAGALHKLPQQG